MASLRQVKKYVSVKVKSNLPTLYKWTVKDMFISEHVRSVHGGVCLEGRMPHDEEKPESHF